MRKLVNHQVHAGRGPVGARFDVGPRQDDGAAGHRLAGERLAAPVYDTGLILVLEPGDEFIRVDDDVLPPVVEPRIEVERQDAGLDRDHDAHQRRDLEAFRGNDALFGQEEHDALTQTSQLGVGVDGEERERL